MSSKRQWAWLWILVALATAGAGCATQAALTPSPAAAPIASPLDDSANNAASPQVVSALIGLVTEMSRTETAPLEGGGSVEYAYWTVRVERYLVDPQPYATIELRFIKGFGGADGSRMPARFPVTLNPGQRAVFFLTRVVGTAHRPVEGATFTTPLGPGGSGGILTISDAEVRTWRSGQSGLEPQEGFLRRVIEIARSNGRTVGGPDSPTPAPTPTAAPPPTPTPPDPGVREAQRRMALPGGIGEVVPGFGGLFVDSKDNGIVYVYMLDPAQQALAEEAASAFLGPRRSPPIREVRVLQGQYTIGQLGQWYDRMRDPAWRIQGLWWTDLDEGRNRIHLGFLARPGVKQEVDAMLDSLGIPREAVIVEVGCSDVGQPWQRPAPPEDPELRLLEVTVQAPARVTPGEPVPLTIRAKNTGDRPVSITTGAVQAQFVVTRPDGAKVWGSMCEMGAMTRRGVTIAFAPGEVKEFRGVWRQWDGRGEPVPEGPYSVNGVLDTHPELASGPAALVVAS